MVFLAGLRRRRDLSADEEFVFFIPFHEPLAVERVVTVFFVKSAIHEEVIKIDRKFRRRSGEVDEPAESPLLIADETLDAVVTKRGL